MCDTDQRARLLYIVSTNRSGSTLLDLLLGNHRQMVSVGEARRIDDWFKRDDLCTCGVPVSHCGFWRQVEQELASRSVVLRSLTTQVARPRRHWRLMPLAIELLLLPSKPARLGMMRHFRVVRQGLEAAHNHWQVLDAVSSLTGASIVVDSSKWADQARLLYLQRPERFRMIYLVRDGRGVAFSQFRRAGVPISAGATNWLVNNLKAIALQEGIPREQRLFLRYEDLCRDPAKHLRTICDFVGLPFDDQVLVINKETRHNIGGSPHRLNKAEVTISLDDKWRQAMTARQLADFERVGGFLNRRLGYALGGEA